MTRGRVASLAITASIALLSCLLPTESPPKLRFSLTDTTIVVPVGTRIPTPVTVLDADGRPVTGARVELSPKTPGTVSIDSFGAIMGLRRGIVDITVRYSSPAAFEPLTGSFLVHAVASGVKIVSTGRDTITAVSDTLRLSTTLVDSHDSVLQDTAKFSWRSLNTSVATVDSTGLVTAVANGSAAFVATAVWDGVSSGYDTVTVAQRVARVVLTPSDTALHALRDSVRITAVLEDRNGHPVVPPGPITWTCVPASVATCNANGFATAIGNGQATVTATTATNPFGARVPDAVVARSPAALGQLNARPTQVRAQPPIAGGVHAPPALEAAAAGAPLADTVSGSATLTVQQQAGGLTVAIQPADSDSAGIPFPRQPVVQVTDRNQFAMAHPGATIRAVIYSAPGIGAALRGDTVQVTDSIGQARFTALSVEGPIGGYTLAFTSTGIGFTQAATLQLLPGTAAKLGFLTQPSRVTAADTIRPAVIVGVTDAFGNLRTGDSEPSVRVTIASGTGAPGSALSGITEVSPDGGLASFAALLTDSVALDYRLEATASGLLSAVSDSFAVVPAWIAVTPPGASVSGVGTTQAFAAEAHDAKSNLVGAPFRWSSLNPSVATVDPATGVAMAVESGQVTVAANVEGVSGDGLLTVAMPGATPVNLWAPMSLGTNETIFSMWGASSSDVSAVGSRGTILHYDGIAWSSMTSGVSTDLLGVWGASASEIFAVGEGGTILHYDGSEWAAMSSGTGNLLRAVWGSSPSHVYALSASAIGDLGPGSILHFDGQAWSNAASSGVSLLSSVWGTSSSNVYAVGNQSTIRRFDGTSWNTVLSGSSGLLGVWGTADNAVFAVGDPGVILRYDGSTWGTMTSGVTSTLAGVWGSSNQDVHVVDDVGLVLHYDGSQWITTDTRTSTYLYGIWGTSWGDVFAFGDSGTIVRGVRGAVVGVTPVNATVSYIGQNTQLIAEARDQSNNMVGGVSFTWLSSDETVATVDETGLVTGTGSGTATITASAPGGASANATIAVRGFVSVTAAGHYTCGALTDGAAYCWGANNSGQLGNGSSTGNSTTPVTVSGGHVFASLTAGSLPGFIPAGAGHTCGLTTAGAVYCWGLNDYGQLGIGSFYGDSTTPVAVFGGHSFASVTAGRFHTCGVTTTGEAFCWGGNGDGQLGNGSNTESPAPVLVSGMRSFASVSAGRYHTCGVTTAGAAYCWGENIDEQLGDGSATERITPVAVSGSLTFSSVTSGDDHTCGLTTAGAAYCWGSNSSGQLGNGSSNNSSTPVAVFGTLSFTSMDAGFRHACAVTTAGAAYCWGVNSYGQLGDGSIGESSTPVPVAPPPEP